MSDGFKILSHNLYEQIDGVAMGFPLDPSLANVFMCIAVKTPEGKMPTQEICG